MTVLFTDHVVLRWQNIGNSHQVHRLHLVDSMFDYISTGDHQCVLSLQRAVHITLTYFFLTNLKMFLYEIADFCHHLKVPPSL